MLSSAKPTTCVPEAFVARTILLLKFAHRGLGAKRAGRMVQETTCNENLSCSEGAQILFA